MPELHEGRPMKAGKFDGVPTPPMFEVNDAGQLPPTAPEPFGRGEKAVTTVWCPLGWHKARVIDDGEHLRYATHWPTKGGAPVMCLASMRCTAELAEPHSGATMHATTPAPAAICHHDKRKAQR